jgi:hypothetical protein
MSRSSGRAVLTIGVLIVVGGIAGLITSAGQAFTEPDGARVASLMHLNPLGSWVSVALGLLTLAAGLRRSRSLALLAGVAALVGVAVVTAGANRPVNLLGGTASTVAFFLGPGVALLSLVLAERAAERRAPADDDRMSTPPDA